MRTMQFNPVALRAFRMKDGLSVRALAEAAGLNDGYLSRLERGERATPSASVVNRLATQLGVPAAAIAPPLHAEPAKDRDVA